MNYNRYKRQIILPELGVSGQKKLLNSKVLVVGAGGLGCPILQYLAASGVGTIGVVDGDIVDETNLHRQILYFSSDVGKYKTQKLEIKLNDLNSDICVDSYKQMINNTNALDIISKYDIVVDGSDNYPTRYMLSDACMILKKPLVYGAVLRFEGQVGVFNLKDKQTQKTMSYRDLFPKPPHASDVQSCAEAGVIGVLPGIIGSLQASEVIKIITGIGNPLANKVLTYNMKTNFFYDFQISQNKNKGDYPKTASQFYNYDYDWFCLGELDPQEISCDMFEECMFSEDIIVIDVREKSEEPSLDGFLYVSIPVSEWENRKTEFISDKKVIVICQSGKRSLEVVHKIRESHPLRQIYSLQGGVLSWVKSRV